MTYEEFLKERETYEYIAYPTDDDFRKYTAAFIDWATTVLRRVETKYGSLK